MQQAEWPGVNSSLAGCPDPRASQEGACRVEGAGVKGVDGIRDTSGIVNLTASLGGRP